MSYTSTPLTLGIIAVFGFGVWEVPFRAERPLRDEGGDGNRDIKEYTR